MGDNADPDGLFYRITGDRQDGFTVTLREDGWSYVLTDRHGKDFRGRADTLWGARRIGRRLLRQERKRRATCVDIEVRDA